MRRRKIAIFLPSLRGGGAERVIVNLLQGFSAKGVDIDLVLAKAEGPYLDQVPSSIRIIDLKVTRVMMALPGLVRYLRKEKPHSLLSVMDHCNIVAIWARALACVHVKTVLSVHSTLSQVTKNSKQYGDKIIPLLMKFFYPYADAIIAVSHGVADDLHLSTMISKEKTSVVYNPIITTALSKMARDKPFHFWFDDSEIKIVIAVGRLTLAKDFNTLIKAFFKVRRECNVRLLILGEGEERASLQKLISDHGLDDDVCLYGFTDNPYPSIAASAVFVLSSIFEGLPTVLVEAMALSTPIVSTDCKSGPKEILSRANIGMLVEVGDVDGMAAAIIETLKNDALNCCSQEVLEPFTITYATEKYLELLN